MRFDKNNPSEEFVNFWDWIVRPWHVVLLSSMAMGHVVYQLTTEEIER